MDIDRKDRDLIVDNHCRGDIVSPQSKKSKKGMDTAD